MPDQPADKTRDEQNPTKEARREFRVFETLSLATNVILVLVGIGAVCVYNGQLAVMRGTLGEMKRSGEQSTQQVWRAIENINWLARSMDGSVKRAQSALDASIQQNRLDQRAWLSVKAIGTTSLTVGKPLIISIAITNTGKTIAFADDVKTHVTVRPAKIDIYSVKNTPTVDRDMVRELGVRPRGGRGTVPPNMEFEMNASSQGRIMSKEEIDSIVSGASKLRVSEEIKYRDIFRVYHVTTYCFVYQPTPIGGSTYFTTCADHNEAN